MNKKHISINFTDFWSGFDPSNNYFTDLLKDDYNIVISDKPDYLFYSVFGNNHQNYNNCCKIFYTGENIEPNLNYADYSMSFDYMDDKRNYRIPHYLLYPGYYDLVNKKVDDNLLNRKFCSFVVSNGLCKDRNEFFTKLSKYKKVDSAGRWLNNMGYLAGNKVNFIKDYKFNICFENDAHRGYNEHYTTEKLMEACVANTLPIYLGNTSIEKEFNTKSFINIRDFKNHDEVIEYIIELDKNDDKYMEVMKQSWLPNNSIPVENKIENIKKFLKTIFN
jgi:hypothetical protein